MRKRFLWMVSSLTIGLPALLLAGCPADLGVAPFDASVAGLYWVEYADGTLSAYALPQDRGAEGTWWALEAAPPTWYTIPGLYELHGDSTWKQITDDPDLTLDEVLQLYDPGPR